jgi:hypothetical protein
MQWITERIDRLNFYTLASYCLFGLKNTRFNSQKPWKMYIRKNTQVVRQLVISQACFVRVGRTVRQVENRFRVNGAAGFRRVQNRGPFLTSPLGSNFDPQGRSCPPGVNVVPLRV